MSSPAGIWEDSVLILHSKGPHCSSGQKSSSLLLQEDVGMGEGEADWPGLAENVASV